MSDDIIVVSTTDTQEAVNEAVGITSPPAETGAGKPKVAAAEQAAPAGADEPASDGGSESETGAGQEPAKQAAGDEEKTKEPDTALEANLPPWMKKRLGRETKKRRESEKTAAELRTENERLRQELESARPKEAGAGKPPDAIKPVAASAASDADPEPKEDDFDNYAAFVKALGAWSYRQEHKAAEARAEKQRADDARQAEAARQAKVFDDFLDRVEQARERYDDYDDVIGQDITLYEGVQLAIVEMPNGPDVAYHLGKNPKEAERLLQMSPLAAIAEVGRIGERLSRPKGETPVQSPPSTPQGNNSPVSSAPAPIKPVGGSGARPAVSIYDENIDMDTYKRLRNQQRG